jgi:uncharacterized protein
MITKTKMISFVKAFQWKEAQRGLDENPDLINHLDDKGRNFLHLCCSVNVKKGKSLRINDSIKLAELLIEKGLDTSTEAFCRDSWKATPLWHALSRGENIKLAGFLLEQGCDPNHCMWAMAFRDDPTGIKLLGANGADIDPVYESDESTPLLVAVKGGHFLAAKALLDLGADVNYQGPKKLTPLHWALKNGAGLKQLRLLLDHGARGDIEDLEGRTASTSMKRKRDPEFPKLAAKYFPG